MKWQQHFNYAANGQKPVESTHFPTIWVGTFKFGFVCSPLPPLSRLVARRARNDTRAGALKADTNSMKLLIDSQPGTSKIDAVSDNISSFRASLIVSHPVRSWVIN